MEPFRFSDLTPKEKEGVIKELSQRLIDLIVITARLKIEDGMISVDKNNLWNTADDIIMNVPIRFCLGDVLQIVSRIRSKV